MNRSVRIATATVIAVVVLAVCGGDNKVGSDKLTDFKEGTPNTRLGQTTTTTAAPTTTTAAASGGGPTTTAKVTTTTAKQVSIEIKIQSDTATSGGAFDPSVAPAVRNTYVRWTNTDTVERSVQFTDGRYDSGPIKPGQSAEYLVKEPVGTVIEYKDGTRPYRTANIEVKR